MLQKSLHSPPGCRRKRNIFAGLAHLPQHFPTNEPGKSTIEPTDSTSEPKESTNEPNAGPTNPRARKLLIRLGFLRLSETEPPVERTRDPNIAERTEAGLAFRVEL